MKLLIAVIGPSKLKAVHEALDKIEVSRLTISDGQGYGIPPGRPEMDDLDGTRTVLMRQVVLEVMLNDDFVDRTVEAIRSAARSGPERTLGDGKIFVVPAAESIQISDGSRGPGSV